MPVDISRLHKLREILEDNKIDIYLIWNPLELRYFLDIEVEGVLVVPSNKNLAYLLTDGRYQHQIQELNNNYIKCILTRNGYFKPLTKLINKIGIGKKLGVEGTVSLEVYLELKKEYKKLVSLFAIRELRMIKDSQEIDRIKKAVEITKSVMNTIKNKVVNKEEKQIKAYLEYQIQSLGGDGSAFSPIVAAGINSAYPHAQPTHRKISNFLLVDCGAKYQGYCADLTRMFFWDKIPRVITQAYEVVTQAQDLAVSLIKEGQAIKDLVVRVENFIKQQGFKDHIYHGLGHGVGLEVHELPYLNRNSSQKLRAGMVVTIEPGLYFPGIGGVRREEVVVVEKNKGVVL